MKSKLIPFFSLPFILLESVSAHCPLCTAGAAIAAGGAVYLGVSKVVVSLFLGAFAVSTGWWVANMIKKKYIPLQKPLLILASFLLTMIPILPLMTAVQPLYISWAGDYGSWLNRTYVLDLSLYSSIFGGLLVCVSPVLSRRITHLRNKTFPFQGVILTLFLLILAGVAIQFAV